jgi:HTH-type transcriptional regulator, sugar sensing transcriptional regulator
VKQYSAVTPALLKEKAIMGLDKTYESKVNELNTKREEILAQKKSACERLSELYKDLTPLYHNSRSDKDPMDYIQIIKEPFQIRRKVIEVMDSAEREILIFDKPPYAGSRKTLEEQTTRQAEPLRRGVIIKSIYQIPKRNGELGWWDNDFEAWYSDIKRSAGQGEISRVIEKLPMKMLVIDERVVMLPLEDPVTTATSFTAQVVEHSSLANGLKILFETMWKQAQDYHVLEDMLKKM